MAERKELVKAWDEKEERMIVVQYQSCFCWPKDQTEPHRCPFQADVNNDDSLHCTCCDSCQYECAMDI
jgi:hypothetical protein